MIASKKRAAGDGPESHLYIQHKGNGLWRPQSNVTKRMGLCCSEQCCRTCMRWVALASWYGCRCSHTVLLEYNDIS